MDMVINRRRSKTEVLERLPWVKQTGILNRS